MMPNMNPQQMEKLMKQMGIKSKNIESGKVIIECDESNIIITNPQVVEIEMQGQKSYQISGTVSTEEKTPEEDISMIMEQTEASREQAENALKECNGDIAEAIIKLKEKK